MPDQFLHDDRIGPVRQERTGKNLGGCARSQGFSHAPGGNCDGTSDAELSCATCHNPHGPLNSGRCGECHEQTPAIQAKHSEKARRYHQVAEARGTECIRCHKGIAHEIPPLVLQQSEREMKRLLNE